MKKRKHLEYGYTLMNGAQMVDPWVDTYNAIQDRINSFIDENMTVPEYLLNASHSFMFNCIEVTNKGSPCSKCTAKR